MMWEFSHNKVTRISLVLFILLVGVGLDQYTKKLAIERRENIILARQSDSTISDDTFYFYDLIRITYAENPGAFLSLGNRLPDGQRFWILTALNSVILLAVAVILIFKRQLYYPVVIALSLVICGGLGNLIDRVLRDGYVVDFLVLGLSDRGIPYSTGIFNVADFFIMVGLGTLLFAEFFAPKGNAQKPESVNPNLATIESHKGKDEK